MMESISLGLTLEASSHSVELIGGSIMMPVWLSQMMNPEVLAVGSKPWLGPRQVTPNSGGRNGSGRRLPIWYMGWHSRMPGTLAAGLPPKDRRKSPASSSAMRTEPRVY